MTIENGDVSPKRMAVLWEQSTDSEFNGNTLDGLTVQQGVRLWEPPVPLPVDDDTVGLWNLDEGSGTVVRDSSPNGNDGTTSGNPSWKVGMFGPSLKFNGINNNVLVPASTDFVFQQLTVEAWIKSNQQSGTIISQEEGTSISWSLSFDEGHLTAKLMTTSPYSLKSFKSVNDYEWHHVALVYNGTIMSIYIDGLRDTYLTTSGAVVDNNLPIRMGCTFNGVNTSFWDGFLDNVRISDIARSSFNVSSRNHGYMISPLIQNLGSFTGELRVNITTSAHTSYGVDIVNETNGTIKSWLQNGDTFNLDPAQLRKTFDETCAEVGAHDVKLVRTYTEGERDPAGFVGESWFYGETRGGDRVDGLVIMVRAQAAGSTLQIMVASNNLAAQTGLLAELGNKVTQRLGGNVEPAFDRLGDENLKKVTYLLDKYGESEIQAEDE